MKDKTEGKSRNSKTEGKGHGNKAEGKGHGSRIEGKGHNKDLGRRGEDAAVAFLERGGFEIIDRNWECIAGEADIVAIDDDALHFIEVKTRVSDSFGFPEESVGKKKRKRYERIAELYLREYDGEDTPVTFDIISILVTRPDRAFLKMFRNVLSFDCP